MVVVLEDVWSYIGGRGGSGSVRPRCGRRGGGSGGRGGTSGGHGNRGAKGRQAGKGASDQGQNYYY